MSKNDLGQRVRNQWEDGTFWDYQYDNLGQVVQGQKKFADGTPLNGYDYGYTFDDIGNRTQAMTNGRTESYTANSVNQYTQRNVSGAIDIVGWANPVDEVLVNNLSPLWQGNYFYKELPVSNSAAPVYQQVDVSAENPANVITTKSGKRYVPKTPEAFSYDDDGNLLSDRRWSYTWDGENRLVAMEAIASAPADAKVKLEFLYDWRGRRIRKTVAPWNAATSSYDAPTKTTKFIYDGWNLLAEVENGVLLNCDSASKACSCAERTIVNKRIDHYTGMVMGKLGTGSLCVRAIIFIRNCRSATAPRPYISRLMCRRRILRTW